MNNSSDNMNRKKERSNNRRKTDRHQGGRNILERKMDKENENIDSEKILQKIIRLADEIKKIL